MKIINVFSFFIVLSFSSQIFAAPSEGKCIFVKGNAFFERSGVKGILTKDATVKEDDLVIIEPSSMAIIKFKYQTIKIEESTKIKIAELDDEFTKISLENGALVINQLKKKLRESLIEKGPLEIITKTASIGIRGTTFFAYQGIQNQTVLSVQEGKVEFVAKNSKGKVLVDDGNSSMSNEENKNLRPRVFGFEKEINYNLDPKKDITSGAGLKSAIETTWTKYKSEQEFLWQDKKKNEESQWDQWKKLNQ